MGNFVPISIDREIENRKDETCGKLKARVIGQLSEECVDALEMLGKLGNQVRAIKLRAHRSSNEYQWYKLRIVIASPSLSSGFNLEHDSVVEGEIRVKDITNPPKGYVRKEILETVVTDLGSCITALQECIREWKALMP